MPRFMDFHQDLKLPAEAIAQIAEDTRNDQADEFGVRQIELSVLPRNTRAVAFWTSLGFGVETLRMALRPEGTASPPAV